jgi:outer membrane protein assembly factor BamE (lipoprotein component of BamABCDE complex)
MKLPPSILVMLAMLPIFGCQSAQNHANNVSDSNTQNLTVGTVQREIRIGMSGAEVVSVLGSPNIVTTDENRQESWVYDRISTTEVYSKSSAF